MSSSNPFKAREEALKANASVSNQKENEPSNAREETIGVNVRLTEKQVIALDELCGRGKAFKNRSEAIRSAIDRVYG